MGKGFKYYYNEESLRKYIKLTTVEKLNCLHEMREFTEKIMYEKTKRIREMFRRAEI